ncbi:MAG: hypothetical protein VB108_01130 [Anaerolineaceae bacterium]|nr:hypothetical protein [Anaerolineaceae bacterium]
MATDGSILIDTKISEDKFNEQADRMSAATKRSQERLNNAIATSVKGTEGQMLKLFNKLGSFLIGTFISIAAVVVAIAAIGESFKSAYKEMDKMPMYAASVNQLSGSFNALKAQFATLAAPLVNLFIPVLQKVVNWLTSVVNTIAQVIAALTRQKTYMQAIANSSGQYAGNMKEAEKAAEGSLASFDKLNVLSKNQADNTSDGGGGAGGGGGITWKEVPIDQKLSEGLEKEKKALSDTSKWIYKHFTKPVSDDLTTLWNDGKEGAQQFYVGVTTGDWSGFSKWWREKITTPIKQKSSTAWADIKEGAGLAWIGIKTGNWSGAKKWFETDVLEPIANHFGFTWSGKGGIKDTVNGVIAPIKIGWGVVGSWFERDVLNPLASKFGTTWTGPDGIADQVDKGWKASRKPWQTAAQWFEDNVFKGIKTGWETVIKVLTGGVTFSLDGVKETFIDAINSAIGTVNTLFSTIETKINRWIDKVNNLISKFGWSIPYLNLPSISTLGGGSDRDDPYPVGMMHLATGAVIPPNAPFAAILGDHKSQREFVAPEGAMVESMLQALKLAGVGRGTGGTVTFDIDESGLMRYLHPKFVEESRRIGPSMISKPGRA